MDDKPSSVHSLHNIHGYNTIGIQHDHVVAPIFIYHGILQINHMYRKMTTKFVKLSLYKTIYLQGCHGQGKKFWKMKNFPGQGKVRELQFQSGKFKKKMKKVMEKSGNFNIFLKDAS